MSIQQFLWENNKDNIKKEYENDLEFLKHIKEMKFSTIFSTKNNYSNTTIFKIVNCSFRILLHFAKNKIDSKFEETLKLFLESLKIESSLYSQRDLFHILTYIMHGLFMKENWFGPSYLSPNANKIMKKNYKIVNNKKYIMDI